MELMERYIYAVTRQLPADMKAEVADELRANILDMLSDEPTEAQIREVLEGLGSPQKLANAYDTRPRYLIGPVLYDPYLRVLKLVLKIMASVIFVGATITGIANSSWAAFGEVMSGLVGGLFQAGAWVTIVFAILERHGETLIKEDWINHLPPVEEIFAEKISWSDTISSVVFTIIGISLLGIFPQIFTVNFWGNANWADHILNGHSEFPIFNLAVLASFLPWMLGFAATLIALRIWQLVTGVWTYKIAIANGLYEVFWTVFSLIFISTPNLFNPDFALVFASHEFQEFYQGLNLDFTLDSALGTLLRLVQACIILSGVFNAYSGLAKCRKSRKKVIK